MTDASWDTRPHENSPVSVCSWFPRRWHAEPRAAVQPDTHTQNEKAWTSLVLNLLALPDLVRVNRKAGKQDGTTCTCHLAHLDQALQKMYVCITAELDKLDKLAWITGYFS